MFVTKAKKPPQRLFVEEPSDNPFWQMIHRGGNKFYYRIRTKVIETWDKWRNSIDLRVVFDALVAGNAGMAISNVERAWMVAENEFVGELQPLLGEIVDESFTQTVPIIEAQTSATFGGGLPTEVRNWIVRHTADWVTQTGDTERRAIRQVILDGMERGQGAATVARDIRQYIGLTKPQADTIARLRESMAQSGIRSDRIEAAIEKRVKKMIRQRAQVIARNESLMAYKMGHRQAYLKAAQEGMLDINTARRFWVITPLDACPTCLPIPGLNPKGRRIDEPFVTPKGPMMEVHAHIQCRCVETFSP